LHQQEVNRVSGAALIVMSLIVLFAVLSGYTQPPQPDEGTAAHIFQLSIVAAMLTLMLFLSTMDWKQPLRSLRRLALPGVLLALAFGPLFHLEHYR